MKHHKTKGYTLNKKMFITKQRGSKIQHLVIKPK